MKWVVLSDLHMKFNNFDSSQARKKLIEELEKKKGSISFVLITGDCQKYLGILHNWQMLVA